jgi:hypothetical protein
VRQQFLLTTCDSPDHPTRSESPDTPYVSICYPTTASFAKAVRGALLSDCEIVASSVRDGAAAVGVREPNGSLARLLCDQPVAGRREAARGRVTRRRSRGPSRRAVARRVQRIDVGGLAW